MAKNPRALTLSAAAGGHFWGQSPQKFLLSPNNPPHRLNHATRISHHACSISTSSKRFVNLSNNGSSPGRRGTHPGAQAFILGERGCRRSLGVPGGFQLFVRETTAEPGSRGRKKGINSAVCESPCSGPPKFVPEALRLCKGPPQCPIAPG